MSLMAGSGALGDLGSHIIDLARFLVGEPKSLMARTGTFISERNADGKKAKVTVDDAFEAVVEYKNGALGTLEATRFAPGRKNHNTFEINAEHGSIRFNLENMNVLEVFMRNQDKDVQGFTQVLVSENPGVLYVPVAGVFVDELEQTVVYVKRGGRAEKRPVVLGGSTDRVAIVESGVEEGAEVLLDPPQAA